MPQNAKRGPYCLTDFHQDEKEDEIPFSTPKCVRWDEKRKQTAMKENNCRTLHKADNFNI